MAYIIPKKTEEQLSLFFDLDGTLKDHSKTEKSLYKLLIPSSINQTNSGYRKVLTTISNIYAPLSKARAFEDISEIPRETSEFATNTLYTLNSSRAIQHFLNKNNLFGPIRDSITLSAKNPKILAAMLDFCQRDPINSLAVLIGDAIVDIENTYHGNSISVALGGPLERRQGRLESISDIYIPEKERQNPSLVRYKIYDRIEKEMEEKDFSKKSKARKGIIKLRNHYESQLEKSL